MKQLVVDMRGLCGGFVSTPGVFGLARIGLMGSLPDVFPYVLFGAWCCRWVLFLAGVS